KDERGFDGMAFSPDGRHVATCGLGGLKVWDTGTDPEAHIILASHQYGEAAYNLQANLCADIAPTGWWVRVGDVTTRQDRWLLWPAPRPGLKFTVYRPTFSPDGKRLAAVVPLFDRKRGGGAVKWEVAVWDTATGAEITTLPSPHRVGPLAF